MKKHLKSTPRPTLRRLPQYLHLLNILKENQQVVTSISIAEAMGLEQTQVRKDIVLTGVAGKPKKGYDIDTLIYAIKEHLNWNNLTDAFLVGAGSLGTALLGYENFNNYGLNFVAAFDNDKNKIGTEVNGIQILSMDKLPGLAKKMQINLGVLTVPAESAQECANLMIHGGIRGIWNFVPKQLNVPDNVVVENAQLTQSLAILTRKLTEKFRTE